MRNEGPNLAGFAPNPFLRLPSMLTTWDSFAEDQRSGSPDFIREWTLPHLLGGPPLGAELEGLAGVGTWELGTDGLGKAHAAPALRASGVAGPHLVASSVASLGALGPERDTGWGRGSISWPPPCAWNAQLWDKGGSAAVWWASCSLGTPTLCPCICVPSRQAGKSRH